MFDELMHILQCEDLARCGNEQFFHVFATYAESTSGDAGDELESACGRGLSTLRYLREMLNPRYLVARRAVILG